MKKLINLCLLLTFLTGYLEWGKDQHAFIFQAEASLLLKARSHPSALMKPIAKAQEMATSLRSTTLRSIPRHDALIGLR